MVLLMTGQSHSYVSEPSSHKDDLTRICLILRVLLGLKRNYALPIIVFHVASQLIQATYNLQFPFHEATTGVPVKQIIP
jgi:hypothetical protein